ncbi:MAG: pimeloyl-ACP methyl ester carboxylesterase [Flavobacteriales bacterium]|jgi:pimeloyl-ACP methyl ester carboxylesterase
MMINKLLAISGWCSLMTLLSGCQLSTSMHFEQRLQQQSANGFPFRVQHKKSSQFNHLIISDIKRESGVLDVYIHGDSHKFLSGETNNNDDLQPMIWDLMRHDPNDKVFVGRPCYFLIKQNDKCESKYWLSHRYSDNVVNAMVEVVNGFTRDYPLKNVQLIGYSGGGAIAILMAHKISNLSAVITIAGNLDIKLWQQHHRYKPLSGSLNPFDSALTKDVTHWHFSGDKDIEVLSRWMLSFAKKHHGNGVVLPNVGHDRGWVERWPSILARVNNENN